LLARGGGRCPLRCRRQLIGDHETFWTLSSRNCRQVSWSWGSRGTRGWPRRRLSRSPAFFIWPRPDRENLCLTGLFLFRRSWCHGYLPPESGQDSFALILPGLHGTPSATEAMSLGALAPRSQFSGTPEEVGSAPMVMDEWTRRKEKEQSLQAAACLNRPIRSFSATKLALIDRISIQAVSLGW